MDHRASVVLALLFVLMPQPARSQTEPPGAAVTPLTTARLNSVTGMPLFFRLYRARLPAAAHASREGANALIYALSGAASLEVEGGATRQLGEGEGSFIPAGQTVTIRSSVSAPAELLLFLLTAGPNQRRPVLDRPAVTRELFRTPEPLAGLQEGPYDLGLSRLTLPSGTREVPASSPTGVALDYVLAGTAALMTNGNAETVPPETPMYEGFGSIRQLANIGREPLVVLRASLSQAAPAMQQPTGK